MRSLELGMVTDQAQAMGTSLLGVGTAALALATKSDALDRGLARLGVVSGATAAELGQMRQAAIDAGLATKFSPDQAVEAMTALSSAGLNARDAMATLNTALNVATASAGKLTTDQSATLVAQTMKSWGLSANQASPAMDKIAKMANAFSASIEDMPLLLANSQRGVAAMGSSVTDTMVSLGLVRNLMPRVESAATAVGVAMESMADPKVQQKLKGLGVTVADTSGKFRAFPDIIADMVPALGKMTQAERAAFLGATFGADAMQGLNAMFTQLTNGVETADGRLLKGAAAISYLRGEIDDSKGALQKFSDAAGGGFGGGLDKLKAQMMTLAQVAGGPLAAAFEPVVNGISRVVKWVARGIESMPQFAKDGLGKVAAVLTALVVGAGGLLVAGAAIGGLVIAVKAAGVAIGAALLPLLLIGGAVALVIMGLKTAIENNVGGLGEKFGSALSTVKLGWQGLAQVFTTGGFSGAVETELNKAENAGLKNFVLNVYGIGMRIVHFFESVKAGFEGVVETMGPTFNRLSAAFTSVGVALGLTTDASTGAQKSWTAFGNAGKTVGSILGGAFDFIVRAIAVVMEVFSGFAGMWPKITASLEPAYRSLSNLGMVIKDVASRLGVLNPGSYANGWQTFGRILGGVATTIGDAITKIVRLFSGLWTAASGFIDMIAGILTGDWTMAWIGAKRVVFGLLGAVLEIAGSVLTTMAQMIDEIIKMLPECVRPDINTKNHFAKFIENRRADLDQWQADSEKESQSVAERTLGAGNLEAARKAQEGQVMAAFAQKTAPENEQGVGTRHPTEVTVPMTVQVMIDGEQIEAAIMGVAKGPRGTYPSKR